MEFLFHHLIGRYVINLPAIGCLVTGLFGVGIVSFFLPINTPANRLLIAIIPLAAAFAAVAEVFRVKARVFVGIPFAWIGYSVWVWLCYSIWSFNGLAASILLLLCFWGAIYAMSHYLDAWECRQAQQMFLGLKTPFLQKEQIQIWTEVSKVWSAPRSSRRSRAAALHNSELIEWMLQNLTAHLNDQETMLLSKILAQLSVEGTGRKLRRLNLKCGDIFTALIDDYFQKVFGKRLHASFRMTSPV